MKNHDKRDDLQESKRSLARLADKFIPQSMVSRVRSSLHQMYLSDGFDSSQNTRVGSHGDLVVLVGIQSDCDEDATM